MQISKVRRQENIIGWREWVALPDFGIGKIKAKVDTGARTSALHAENVHIYTRAGRRFVKFTVHPIQRSKQSAVTLHAPLKEKRTVKSSVGTETTRPVILVDLKIGEELFPIELTLVNRDVMGFRMLLGRQAIRNRFVVDPGRSFLTRKVKKSRRRSQV